jgi:hypothetical protein
MIWNIIYKGITFTETQLYSELYLHMNKNHTLSVDKRYLVFFFSFSFFSQSSSFISTYI